MSETAKTARTPARRSPGRAGWCWVIACLAFAAACFAAAAPKGFWSRRTGNPARATAAPPPAPTCRTRPIEQLRVGEKVIACNPDLTEVQRPAPREACPATWRTVTLEMTTSAGRRVNVQLLRPPRWLAATGTAPGKTIDVSLPALDARGPAKVLSVEPCRAPSR